MLLLLIILIVLLVSWPTYGRSRYTSYRLHGDVLSAIIAVLVIVLVLRLLGLV